MATASKSARSTPADGDAFLTSAMTPTPPARPVDPTAPKPALPLPDELIMLVGAWLAVAAAGAVAAALARRAAPRAPLLPPQRRRAVAWTGPRVAAAFLVLFLTPSLIGPL